MDSQCNTLTTNVVLAHTTKTKADDFNFLKVSAAAVTLFEARGDGLFHVHEGGLLIDKVGETITVAGMLVLAGGETIDAGGLNVAEGGATVVNSACDGHAAVVKSSCSSSFTGTLLTGDTAQAAATSFKLLEAKASTSLHFDVRGDGRTTVHNSGLKVLSGGATVTDTGLLVSAGGATVKAGGLTVTANGATVTNGGLKVTGGATINHDADATVLSVQATSATQTADVFKATTSTSGAALFSSKSGSPSTDVSLTIPATTGASPTPAVYKIFRGGLNVNLGGATIFAGGLSTTKQGATIKGGLVVLAGGVTVGTEGLKVSSPGRVTMSSTADSDVLTVLAADTSYSKTVVKGQTATTASANFKLLDLSVNHGATATSVVTIDGVGDAVFSATTAATTSQASVRDNGNAFLNSATY